MRILKSIKLSWMGKISALIILGYIVVALIVPYLNMPNPLYYKAPPEDIFAPQILKNITFSENIIKATAVNNILYMITEKCRFIALDLSSENTIFQYNLSRDSYSELYLLHYLTTTSIIFHSSQRVYWYNPQNMELKSYNISTEKLFIIEQPFIPFAGFAAYGNSTIEIYSLYPVERPEFKMVVKEIPLGLHMDFKSIYISYPTELWKIYYDGEIKWKINGNFTSNPIFLSSYEGNYVYVGEGNVVDRINPGDGEIVKKFSLGEKIVHLEYYGQSLFAISAEHTFGKVNILGGGYSWILKGVKKYFMDPWIDGLSVKFTGGKIGFVLLSTGEIQWGYEFPAENIFVNKISYTSRDVVAYKGRDILIFSASGKLITPLPPNKKYPLGTDNTGRDVLSQLLWSFRTEIYIALVSAFVVALIGTTIGILAGYYTGPVDDILRLLSDSFLLIPAIGYAALMLFVLGITQHVNATLLASLFAVWPIEARAVRNYTKVIKEKPFIEAARVMGASNIRIMVMHILPEVIMVSMVYALSGAAMALLLEVGVSFLGFGNYMVLSWGWMIANGYFVGIWDRWWISLPPLLTLMLLVISIYLLSKDIHDNMIPEDTTML
ncbi:MAG: ABC transporter permease [Thermoplasmata archaeon]|nr:ABC transporter permease [Thermoplasmata archaeon]